MAKKKKDEFIDLGTVENKTFVPSKEVQEEFEEAAQLGSSGKDQLEEKLREHHSTSPALSGGDIDAAWEDSDVGEESVGGENPTPDQSVVDELGQAVGITYQGGEPLHTTEKLEGRDEHRWELDPASSEGYQKRLKDTAEDKDK